jgi:alpha-ketoglutarate-dependent taurine dioxygenase
LTPAGFHPLWDCRHRFVFYAPWLISHDSHQGLGGAFVADLIAQSLSNSIRVRLAPGQSLFIDNQRMLHGRDALATTSMRWLTRWWIKAHPIATAG